MSIKTLNKNLCVGLDIGTTKVAMVVGEENEEGKINVLAFEKEYCEEGLHEGKINKAIKIKEALEKIMERVQKKIGESSIAEKIVVGVNGESLNCELCEEKENLKNEEITRNNINRLKQKIENQTLKNNNEKIIEVFPLRYWKNGEEIEQDPIGIEIQGDFKIEFLRVTFDADTLEKIEKCLQELDLKVQKFTIGSFASARAIFKDEKIPDIAVVDIGGGTTNLVIFKKDIKSIYHISSKNIGGHQITKAIEKKYPISFEDAEKTKTKYGSTYPKNYKPKKDVIEIKNGLEQESTFVDFYDLSETIHKQMLKIVKWVDEEIKKYANKNGMLFPPKVIFTGGGSRIENFKIFLNSTDIVAQNITYEINLFSADYLIGDTKNIKEDATTAVGLLIHSLSYNKSFKKESFLEPDVKIYFERFWDFFKKKIQALMEFLESG